jgi:hypothetical protein
MTTSGFVSQRLLRSDRGGDKMQRDKAAPSLTRVTAARSTRKRIHSLTEPGEASSAKLCSVVARRFMSMLHGHDRIRKQLLAAQLPHSR